MATLERQAGDDAASSRARWAGARAVLWVLAIATLIGTLSVRPDPAAPVRVVLPIVEPRVLPVVVVPPVPPPPPPASPTGCSDHPEEIGVPESPYPIDAGSSWWIEVGRRGCVIAVRSHYEVHVSWDDGRTFTRVLDDPSDVVDLAIGDDGAVYVMRESFRLGIARADGSSVWRTLSFRGELHTSGRWLIVGTPAPALRHDGGATWRHLEWNGDWLADIRVEDDGTIVALADFSGTSCDHFGCPGVTTEVRVSHLDGRPWQPGSRAQTRAMTRYVRPAELPPELDPWRLLDAHRLAMISHGSRVVRYSGGRWRVLFAGGPPWR